MGILRKPIPEPRSLAATVTERAAARKLEIPGAPKVVTKAERRRFMSGNTSDIRGKPQKPPEARQKRGRDDPEDDPEFQKHVREVIDFITPQLGRREKRLMEERKIRALGGTLDRRQVMPYSLLQKLQKKHKEKRAVVLAEERTLGVSLDASKHRQVYEVDKLLKDKKERSREGPMYHIGMGAKEKRGVAFIPGKQVKNFQRRGGGGGKGGGKGN